MKVGIGAALDLECGKAPRCGDLKITSQAKIRQLGAQVRRAGCTTMTNPYAPVQIRRVAARCVDLHIQAQLITEQIAMIGRHNNVLHPQTGQHLKGAPQFVQDAVHGPPRQGNVVSLAQCVDLLRGNQCQVRVTDAVPDWLLGLGKQVVQPGDEHWDAGMVLQVPDPIWPASQHGVADFQTELALFQRHDRGRSLLGQQRRHTDLGDGGDCAPRTHDRELETIF